MPSNLGYAFFAEKFRKNFTAKDAKVFKCKNLEQDFYIFAFTFIILRVLCGEIFQLAIALNNNGNVASD